MHIAGSAVAQSAALLSMLDEAGLPDALAGAGVRIEGFATVDSCSTNVGESKGVVALINAAAGLGAKLYLQHCYCHVLHNCLGTGMCKGWGRAQSTCARAPIYIMSMLMLALFRPSVHIFGIRILCSGACKL